MCDNAVRCAQVRARFEAMDSNQDGVVSASEYKVVAVKGWWEGKLSAAGDGRLPDGPESKAPRLLPKPPEPELAFGECRVLGGGAAPYVCGRVSACNRGVCIR